MLVFRFYGCWLLVVGREAGNSDQFEVHHGCTAVLCTIILSVRNLNSPETTNYRITNLFFGRRPVHRHFLTFSSHSCEMGRTAGIETDDVVNVIAVHTDSE